ncbi:MAG: matrixin family metalloprotease [Bacteroidetes bacterium]|nr:matrixin family metalloprotease [Bacteroidota bacterium]
MTPEILKALRNRGVIVMGSVPVNALLVAAPSDVALTGLGISWRGMLEVDDKISASIPTIANDRGRNLIFEFFKDVDPRSARDILKRSGVVLSENPELSPWQFMGRASLSVARRVAENDALHYVFPAAQEFLSGNPLRYCQSARGVSGVPAAMAGGVGDGWDGPGRGSSDLTYSLGPITSRMPADSVRREISRALDEWNRHIKVSFTETLDPIRTRNIEIRFASRDHSDDISFDGRGGALAHTYYPAPPNNEPIAGDVHLDGDEPWEEIDLYSIVLHELGHALGLGHSGDPSSIMYPFYRKVTALAQVDIDAALQLYAQQDRPSSGSQIPATVLEISIDTIPSSTADSEVSLSGSINGGEDPVSLRWQSSAGSQGYVHGMRNWTIQGVPLNWGPNRIEVVATDAAGMQFSRYGFIERDTSPITIEPLQVTVSASSEFGVISITASSAWTASCDADWIVLSRYSGSGSGLLGFYISENPANIGRKGTITIGDRSFGVTQLGRLPDIEDEVAQKVVP